MISAAEIEPDLARRARGLDLNDVRDVESVGGGVVGRDGESEGEGEDRERRTKAS